MPQKVVMEIPANPMLGDLRKRKRKLRVAAYCRVSTEEEENRPHPDKIHFPICKEYPRLHQARPNPQKLGYPRYI